MLNFFLTREINCFFFSKSCLIFKNLTPFINIKIASKNER